MILPTTTTDRLLAVADRIEFQPENWNQATWVATSENFSYINPAVTIGQGDEFVDDHCGTTACIAGWAVLLTPVEQRAGDEKKYYSYANQAKHSLGITEDLADELFYELPTTDPAVAADILRRLAKYPEPRTTDHLAKIVKELEL